MLPASGERLLQDHGGPPSPRAPRDASMGYVQSFVQSLVYVAVRMYMYSRLYSRLYMQPFVCICIVVCIVACMYSRLYVYVQSFAYIVGYIQAFVCIVVCVTILSYVVSVCSLYKVMSICRYCDIAACSNAYAVLFALYLSAAAGLLAYHLKYEVMSICTVCLHCIKLCLFALSVCSCRGRATPEAARPPAKGGLRGSSLSPKP